MATRVPPVRRETWPLGDVAMTLQDIEHVVRAAWGVEICEDPADVPHWSPENRSWGQCGPTALVVHDLLGGQLCAAEVHLVDGTQRGFRWWKPSPWR